MTHPTKSTLLPGNAGIRQLISALRQPMPEGFVWDFMTTFETENDSKRTAANLKEEFGPHCQSAGCAMGLARTLYSNVESNEGLNTILQMPKEDFHNIFWNEQQYEKEDVYSISPDDVADKLEEYLEKVEGN